MLISKSWHCNDHTLDRQENATASVLGVNAFKKGQHKGCGMQEAWTDRHIPGNIASSLWASLFVLV